MSSADRLLQATERILRPLVRMLIRHSISADTVGELLRSVYVHVAAEDFTIDRKPATQSRIAVLTGLNRKEVSRLLKLRQGSEEPLRLERNRAAQVISAWIRDKSYADSTGEPGALAFSGEGTTFTTLVEQYSGDMRPRSVADELLRVGAIEEVAGKFQMTTHGYVPASDPEYLIDILGTDTAEIAATITHNVTCESDDRYYQRKTFHQNIPIEFDRPFRKYAAKRAQRLLEDLDRWLAERALAARDSDCETVDLGFGAFLIRNPEGR